MGLLDLPRELRDQILSYILIKPEGTMTMLCNYHCLQFEDSACQPSISMVNKQLRAETLPMFYSSNLFLAEPSDATDLATAKNWLAAIGEANVRHLRHMTISGYTRVEVSPTNYRHSRLRMTLDLREGELVLEEEPGWKSTTPSVMECVDALGQSFREMVKAKGGQRFTGREVGMLFEGFQSCCPAYW